jgi:malate dehydrogenase
MSTVAIIGAGDLGGAVAHALASSGRIARLVLVDDRGAIAAGKALDLQQSGAIARWRTQLVGTDDLSRAAGAAACVLADRAGQPALEWQGNEGAALLTRLIPYAGTAPLVFAGHEQGGLLLTAARDIGVDPQRLVGSASEALAAAMRAVVALEARCSPMEVALAILGGPARGFVVPWSEASIGGYAISNVLSQAQLTRLGEKLAPLWPPGPFTLGMAAARVTNAVLQSSRRRASVLTVIDGALGVRHTVGALPCLLAPWGIADARVPTLSTRERVQVETALSERAPSEKAPSETALSALSRR